MIALRVPGAASAKIIGEPIPIRTIHCRTPDCANFSVPARTKPDKTGPSYDPDPHYRVISTKRGTARYIYKRLGGRSENYGTFGVTH